MFHFSIIFWDTTPADNWWARFIFLVWNDIVQFILYFFIIISDMAEVDKFTNIYQLARLNWLCSTCTVLWQELNELYLSNSVIRTPSNMWQVIANNQVHEFSIHPENNIFWKIRYLEYSSWKLGEIFTYAYNWLQ